MCPALFSLRYPWFSLNFCAAANPDSHSNEPGGTAIFWFPLLYSLIAGSSFIFALVLLSWRGFPVFWFNWTCCCFLLDRFFGWVLIIKPIFKVEELNEFFNFENWFNNEFPVKKSILVQKQRFLLCWPNMGVCHPPPLFFEKALFKNSQKVHEVFTFCEYLYFLEFC